MHEAYLHVLVKVREMLVLRLLTLDVHNEAI
jgi:hypothetical protein